MRLIALMLCASFLLSGCYPVVKEYVWIRDDGDVFKLKWKIDEKKALTLIEEFTASSTSSGYLAGPAGTKHFIERNYFNPCSVVDDANWACSSLAEESISMIDGKITHKYWAENRIYKTKYKLVF